MSNWKQKIEAEIARERYTGKVELTLDQANALLDVAVAAERLYEAGYDGVGLMRAFDKLREAGDE